MLSQYRNTAVLYASVFLVACGGSGGSDAPGPVTPTNQAPTAAAGADQAVDELSTVMLDGSSSSDPDNGDTITYSWSQTAGTTVTLSSATVAQPTFTAPDVTAVNTPDTLTFQLAVNDGTATNNDTVDIVVSDVGIGANTPPTANAGPDETVAELTTVNLSGATSSDPDGDTLTFAWTQTAGPGVTLTGANTDTPSFTAPDVAAPVLLTFQLVVDDSTDNASDTVDITVQEGLSQVTVSGILSYEFVPAARNASSTSCSGLDFAQVRTMPIRAATVQLLDSADTVLGEVTAGDDGSYSFDNIAASLDVRVRVRAELKRSGAPSWDVEVRDNVDLSTPPPPLPTRPLYVIQWPLFNTGVTHINDANFTATTGWDGSAYTGSRAAAPFAVLDSIYTGMRLILDADPTAIFAPLDAFWSINNTPVSGVQTDVDTGEFGPSAFYRGDIDALFLSGDAAVNTMEFDYGVVLHEWGHYFEDTFSRSDSVGGRHFLGELVEARVSFGEGWGSAIGAMASGDPLICNTGAVTNGAGSFGYNMETFNFGPQGWYNELSVGTLLYDLFDDNDDGVDDNSIGFGPIYEIMTGPQTTTEAFTTIFSFASLLRPTLTPTEQDFLDALLAAENIETTGLDIWATTQNNINVAPNNSRDVMPLYTEYTPGTTINICTNSDHDPDDDGNKPAEHRYLRVTTTTQAAYGVTVAANPQPPPTTDPAPTPPDVIRDRSDPDVIIQLDGVVVGQGFSGDDDVESFTTQSLAPDTYVVAINEFRFGDEDQSSDYPSQVCFDVTMTAQ